MFISLMHGY
jgi:pre-mRNA-processing factor 8